MRIESDAVHLFKGEPVQKYDGRKHVFSGIDRSAAFRESTGNELALRVTPSLPKRCV
jgi:hypothetical protein